MTHAATVAFACLTLLAGCGGPAPADAWRVVLRDPAGRAVPSTDIVLIRFDPDESARRVLVKLNHPAQIQLDVPALEEGHYEAWVPGCRPLRIDRAPSKPLQLLAGYPVDVSWASENEIATGHSICVKATWRGPGDHPEAVLRTRFASAAPEAGARSWNFIGFVKGILITPPRRQGRLYVPWPGRYRLVWGIGAFRIQESGHHFSAFGGGTWSADDAASVEVPADGPAPSVTIPLR